MVNSKCISSNALNSLRTQNKDLGTASQTLLTKVKLCQPRSQGLSSSRPSVSRLGGKMRDPGNEVEVMSATQAITRLTLVKFESRLTL